MAAPPGRWRKAVEGGWGTCDSGRWRLERPPQPYFARAGVVAGGLGVPRQRPHAGAGHRRLRCRRRGRSPGRRSAREARAGTAGASQDPVTRVTVFFDLAMAAGAGGLLAVPVMLFFRVPTVGRGIRPMRRSRSWPRASRGRAGAAGASGERRVLMTLAVRSEVSLFLPICGRLDPCFSPRQDLVPGC